MGKAAEPSPILKTMTTLTAVESLAQTLRSVDWKRLRGRTVKAARFTWAATQLLSMVVMILAEVAYENRQQIRDGIVGAVSAAIVTTEAVLRAGEQTRAWVDRMNAKAADTVAQIPNQMAPIAPIAAPVIVIIKSAVAATNDWLGFSYDACDGNSDVDQKSVPSYEELMALSAATLREMVGTRSRYPKAQLVAMILA